MFPSPPLANARHTTKLSDSCCVAGRRLVLLTSMILILPPEISAVFFKVGINIKHCFKNYKNRDNSSKIRNKHKGCSCNEKGAPNHADSVNWIGKLRSNI